MITEPAAPADRWHSHAYTRKGFHWYRAEDGGPRVDVPSERNPLYREHLAPLRLDRWEGAVPHFAAEHTETVLDLLRRAFGRDGHDAVAHGDVDVRLDRVETTGRLDLTWAGLLLAVAGEHESWTKPRTEYCTVVAGALLLEGHGPQRRISWQPGTVLRVHDVPLTCLDGQNKDAYAVVATSDEDPHDALRRDAHRLLGLRYRTDIPPFPADASEGRVPGFFKDWPPTLRRVPTDYPRQRAEHDLAVDPQAGTVYVRRSAGGYFTEYVVPLTDERAALIERVEDAFTRSAAAYAEVGADAEAAARLTGTEYTPARLHPLLHTMAVRTGADARALTARTPQQWADAGWDLNSHSQPAGQPMHGEYEHQRCWSATEAAAFADAGITAHRAYELRKDGERIRTVAEAVAQDTLTPTAVGRHAVDLLAWAEQPVPEELRTALATARTEQTRALKEWEDNHYSWGVSVTLAQHDFTLLDGTVRTLWTVSDGWWSRGEDADAGERTATHLAEAAARSAWRTWREAHNQQAAGAVSAPVDLPCPGPDVKHCDNCGATEPGDNEFLPALGWMSASLGLACGVECYDAMSDGIGRHDRLHHR
ncbi:hypothetical protein [Streptomyces sp. NRRL S-350]|uniref:hypothetical protein n=1 Tax=Streptomyces sp. NRRL S-350 TaxID=1463902 RepID=UPI0004C28C3F|nr:hypothetical protein [Streptomyces sp. NRRL S-350]